MNTYPFEQHELFRKYPDLLEFIKILRFEIQEAQRPADEQLLDDVDLQNLLKVSKRTTAMYRAEGLISYSQIKDRGKIYYRLSDILKAIELNIIPAIHDQIRLGKN